MTPHCQTDPHCQKETLPFDTFRCRSFTYHALRLKPIKNAKYALFPVQQKTTLLRTAVMKTEECLYCDELEAWLCCLDRAFSWRDQTIPVCLRRQTSQYNFWIHIIRKATIICEIQLICGVNRMHLVCCSSRQERGKYIFLEHTLT